MMKCLSASPGRGRCNRLPSLSAGSSRQPPVRQLEQSLQTPERHHAHRRASERATGKAAKPLHQPRGAACGWNPLKDQKRGQVQFHKKTGPDPVFFADYGPTTVHLRAVNAS